MVSKLCGELPPDFDLVPAHLDLGAVTNAPLSLGSELAAHEEVEIDLPHIAETALLEVLASVDVEFVVPHKRDVVGPTVGQFATHRKELVPRTRLG